MISIQGFKIHESNSSHQAVTSMSTLTSGTSATIELNKQLTLRRSSDEPFHPAESLFSIVNNCHLRTSTDLDTLSPIDRVVYFWFNYPASVSQENCRLSASLIDRMSKLLNVPCEMIMELQNIYDEKCHKRDFVDNYKGPVECLNEIIAEKGLDTTPQKLAEECFPNEKARGHTNERTAWLKTALMIDKWNELTALDITRLCHVLKCDTGNMLKMWNTYCSVSVLEEFKSKELTGIWKLIRETIINKGSIDGDITCMLEDIDNIIKTNYSKAIQSLIYDSNVPALAAMKCMFIHAMTLVKFDDITITNTFKSIDEAMFDERYATPKKVAEIIAAHINK